MQAGHQQHHQPSPQGATRWAAKVVLFLGFRAESEMGLAWLVPGTAAFGELLQCLPRCVKNKVGNYTGGRFRLHSNHSFHLSTALPLVGCGLLGEIFPFPGSSPGLGP